MLDSGLVHAVGLISFYHPSALPEPAPDSGFKSHSEALPFAFLSRVYHAAVNSASL